MLDFGCADAESQRTECAMRGSVTVTTDDGHAGLGQSQFRADDVDNAALGTVQAVERDSKLGRVLFHLADLGRGNDIRNRKG